MSAFKRLFGFAPFLSVVACSFIVDTDEIDEGCATGTKYCAGRCVSVNDAAYGCGVTGCNPCINLPDGNPFGDRYVPECSNLKCVIGRCALDWGCEACDKHLLTDEENCGTCMHDCGEGFSCSVGECVPSDDGAGGAGGAGADATSTQPDASAQQRNPTL